jgi:hypothetical protein
VDAGLPEPHPAADHPWKGKEAWQTKMELQPQKGMVEKD